MNFQEIVDALQKHYIDYEDEEEANEKGEREYAEGFNQFAEVDEDGSLPETGSWKEVDSHGGSDQGSDWWSVRYFADHDIYIRIHGWYSSYEGFTFEKEWSGDLKQVYPYQETVTKFSDKQK